MKKKNKWPKRIVLLTLTLIASFVIMLVSYVAGYEKDLMVYQESLAKLPEVASVKEIAQYNGTEQYYVAKVNLTNGSEQYYFIKDDVVAYNIETKDVLSQDEIYQKATKAVAGTVTHYYLGIYEETPIYEVAITTDNGEHYVIVNAVNGEVMATVGLN